MIPLRDNIPTARFPIVTVILIAINLVVFIWQLNFPPDTTLEPYGFSAIDQSSIVYGAVPYRVTHPGSEDCALVPSNPSNPSSAADFACAGTQKYEQTPPASRTAVDQAPWFVTLFTSMFMHGGWLHIAGNMLFLWVFGNNIEDSMGRLKFILFYLLAGLVALYSQAALDPSATVPTIGASGAVAGVLGAYALLHPKARVLSLIFIVFFVTLIEVPALLLLGIWFVLQFLPAVGQLGTPDVGGGGVAYFAHVGGFIFGLLAIKLFVSRRAQETPSLPY